MRIAPFASTRALYRPPRRRTSDPDAIHPVNGILRGVFVPPGEHEVTLTYLPASFRIGLGGTGLGVLVVAWIAIASFRRRRRPEEAVSRPRRS
ncbi:MAG: hypothetical protein PHN82_04280 [bacterium]|nr:hypothetical protein [bacterium]